MFSEASHGWPLDAALRPRQVEADECVCREKPRWGRRTVIVGPMRLRSLFAVMPCRTSGRRCTCHCNSRVPVACAPGTLHMFADRNPVPHRTTSSSVTASCAVKVHFQTGAVARRGVGGWGTSRKGHAFRVEVRLAEVAAGPFACCAIAGCPLRCALYPSPSSDLETYGGCASVRGCLIAAVRHLRSGAIRREGVRHTIFRRAHVRLP